MSERREGAPIVELSTAPVFPVESEPRDGRPSMTEEEFEAFWDQLDREVNGEGAESAVEAGGQAGEKCPAPVRLTLEEQIRSVRHLVVEGKASHREILRKILVACDSMRELGELEQLIQSYPEYQYAAQNPYRLLVYLEEACGLERFDLDADLAVVTEDRKVGKTENEVDDLIATYGFKTTEAGRVVADELAPAKRLDELFSHALDRAGAYRDLLEFCHEPRSMTAIDRFFRGKDLSAVRSLNTGSSVAVKPSALVDKMEKAGGIVWKNGWVLTGEGEAFLDTVLKARL